MKSVGEAMAIGRTFRESVQKCLRSRMERGIYAASPHECIETLENFEWPVYAHVEAA